TFEGGPAVKGGVKEGDVITGIADQHIGDGRELQKLVAQLPLGKPVKFSILRDGQPRTVEVVIEEQPDQLGALRVPAPRAPERDDSAVNLEKVGITATDLTPELAERLGYAENARGAVVVRVAPDSPAAEAELVRGVLISKVEKTPVASAAELRTA